MIITVDIGNTNIKVTLFRNGKVYDTKGFSSQHELSVYLSDVDLSQVKIIVCSVAHSIEPCLAGILHTAKKGIILSSATPVPIINDYGSPDSLGSDRLATAVGASVLFPGKTCLVIDAGTAITFDLILNGKTYAGGAISPGISTRYKSLATFTGKLPLLSLNILNSYPGKTTEESIQNGIQQGILYETEGYISELGKLYPDLHVIVTGGDYDFFVRNIKRTIFAQPNLIALGLYRILEYNA